MRPESGQERIGQESVAPLQQDITGLKNFSKFPNLLGADQTSMTRPIYEAKVAKPGGD